MSDPSGRLPLLLKIYFCDGESLQFAANELVKLRIALQSHGERTVAREYLLLENL